MKLKARNFPHPVLHPTMDDIVKSHFKITITHEVIDGANIEFDVSFKVKNDTLNTLIENRSAHLTVHFECHSTMQRISYQIEPDDCTITKIKNETIYKTKIVIDGNLLNKKIDLNYFILASKDISEYTNTNMHEDFAGLSFNIEKGDILAVAITQTLHLEKEPIVKTSSIFNIVKDDNLLPFSIFIDNNQIDIYFPEEIHEKIKSYNEFYGEQANKILIQMVCYPALLHVLYIVESVTGEELEDYEGLDWFITLDKALKDLGKSIYELNIDEIPTLSYKILNEDTIAPWLELENILDNIGDETDDEY